MRADGEPRPVPADATVALLRVAQEALVNAAKHAAGQPVTVRLHYEASGITLTVRNPLAAGGTAGGARIRTADTGYGLTSMRERVRLLGGMLGAGPGDGHWSVTASLPLPPESRPPDSLPSRAEGQP
jgi:signal transduction histidine kinase